MRRDHDPGVEGKKARLHPEQVTGTQFAPVVQFHPGRCETKLAIPDRLPVQPDQRQHLEEAVGECRVIELDIHVPEVIALVRPHDTAHGLRHSCHSLPAVRFVPGTVGQPVVRPPPTTSVWPVM